LISACNTFFNSRLLQAQSEESHDATPNALQQGLELLREGQVGAPELTAGFCCAMRCTASASTFFRIPSTN